MTLRGSWLTLNEEAISYGSGICSIPPPVPIVFLVARDLEKTRAGQ